MKGVKDVKEHGHDGDLRRERRSRATLPSASAFAVFTSFTVKALDLTT